MPARRVPPTVLHPTTDVPLPIDDPTPTAPVEAAGKPPAPPTPPATESDDGWSWDDTRKAMGWR